VLTVLRDFGRALTDKVFWLVLVAGLLGAIRPLCIRYDLSIGWDNGNLSSRRVQTG
jgi:hypothetical protein